MAVKLGTQLPKTDTGMNGLDQLAAALTERPGDPHIIVALVDCAKTEIEHDGGSKTPTVRILAVEALTRRDALEAQRMLDEARRHRIALDRTPTGGLFGDPIADTSGLLKDHRDGVVTVGKIDLQHGSGVVTRAELEADRLMRIADERAAYEADERSREAGVPVDRD